MQKGEKTADSNYTKRLVSRSHKKWKLALDVQLPYRWNIRRLKLGKTLDVGCGIGRILQNLPPGSVGVDHNKTSIKLCREIGLEAYHTKSFHSRHKKRSFDSMILTHVLEHVSTKEGKNIIAEYSPYIKDRLVLICPQKKGFAYDDTHINFLSHKDLEKIAQDCGFCHIEKSYSFPLPGIFGSIFAYNETVVVARRSTKEKRIYEK